MLSGALMFGAFSCNLPKSNLEKPKTNRTDSEPNQVEPLSDPSDPSDSGSGGSSGDDGSSTSLDSGIEPGMDLEQLLKDCGAPPSTGTPNPDEVLLEKELSSVPFVVSLLGPLDFLGFTDIHLQADVSLLITREKSSQVLEPRALSSFVDSFLGVIGNMKTTTDKLNVPFSKMPVLSQTEPWKGVLCTVIGATQITNSSGGRTTVSTYDPPIPAAVSPKAIAERYDLEIGSKKVFSNIEMKVTSSNDPALNGVSKIVGKVTIERLEDRNMYYSYGEDGVVPSDLAFRMISEFGTSDQMKALGIVPLAKFYINHSKRDLAGNQAEIGGLLPEISFIHP